MWFHKKTHILPFYYKFDDMLIFPFVLVNEITYKAGLDDIIYILYYNVVHIHSVNDK